MKNNETLIIFDLFGVVFNKGLESSIDRLVAVLNRPEDEIEKAYRHWEQLFDRGEIDEDIFWSKINIQLGSNINPSVLSNIVISAYRPRMQTIQLARFLKRHHKVVVYSNYRKEWFNQLDDIYDIEVNFDDVIISSDTGLLKPDANVFYYLEREFKVPIENMVLIDDDISNISGIKNLGGNGVLFRNVYEAEVITRSILKEKMPSYDYSYSGILIRTKQGALIFQRRDKKPSIQNSGKLSVFGGRGKKKENPVECALRELWEETGIIKTPEEMTLLRNYGAPDENDCWVNCSYFLVEAEVNDIDIREGHGVEVWYPNQALDQKDLTDVPRVLIESIIEKKQF
ncbi:NUDIX domain-containing protein [Paraglaciecola hydrolytica]|uniref:Nudix hydrolase domain-containing protein n=1 Tax=Paraglaciecola hydrolytica TaxID=1799789 RepID=A0A148KKH0_9ALTE|nr:NUDIX domain-containing protein [Paraglaciecola hydrolytica]KXI26787.1 hypothetical protein AX660_03185 [Paraglaciecola hydrolytica]